MSDEKETVCGGMEQLSDAQQRAIALLVAGKKITDVAAGVDVNRGTIYRWLNDPDFAAALNGQRIAMRQSDATKLEAMVTDAIEVVGLSLEQGNVATALTILRGLGFLTNQAPEIGSDDAAALKKTRQSAMDDARGIQRMPSMKLEPATEF